MSVPLINSGGGANKLLRSFSRSTQLSLKRSKNLNNFLNGFNSMKPVLDNVICITIHES